MAQEPEQQWEADLPADSCSLSGARSQRTCASFFPALVIIWSRGISSRPRVSVSCGRKLKCTLGEACDPLRNKLGVLNQSLVDSELSLNDFNGLRRTLEARRPCETASFVYVFYVFLGNFMPSLEL